VKRLLAYLRARVRLEHSPDELVSFGVLRRLRRGGAL
jgi:hypothetical protein